MKDSSEMSNTGTDQRTSREWGSNQSGSNTQMKDSSKGGPGTSSTAGHATGRPDEMRKESEHGGQHSQSDRGSEQHTNAGNTGFSGGQVSQQTHDQSNRGGSAGKSAGSDRNH